MNSLRKFQSEVKIAQEKLAKLLDVAQPTITKVEKGQMKLPSAWIDKIIEIYPQYDKTYFESDQEFHIVSEEDVKYGLKATPFYEIDFYSGFDKVFTEYIHPAFYFTHPDFQNADFAVRNSGHSMSKVIKNRDIIGLRAIQDWRQYFIQGEIYAIITKNDLRTIKLVRVDKEKSLLLLYPKPLKKYKKDYPEYEEIPIDYVEQMYQITARMTTNKFVL